MHGRDEQAGADENESASAPKVVAGFAKTILIIPGRAIRYRRAAEMPTTQLVIPHACLVRGPLLLGIRAGP